MKQIKILWADDEIDLLKPHVLFLEEKGYNVRTASSGNEALEMITEFPFDIIFLDENMPGLSGIETLDRIKTSHPTVPVIMITKNEDETLMEEAIGSKISDYLIKPVHPKQILLTLKKNLGEKRLVSEKTTLSYQQEFRTIGMAIGDRMNANEWSDIYRKLTHWDLELNRTEDSEMDEVLKHQMTEANVMFNRFVETNYESWINNPDEDTPVMSHNVLSRKVFPHLKDGKKVFLVVIDNLRFDQWRILRPLITGSFRVEEEETYYSILPTATQYARNSMFAGLMPLEIEKNYPQYWINESEEGSKNKFEGELLAENLKRCGIDASMNYQKVTNLGKGKKLAESLINLQHNDLNVLVYNFVDMLSHARTDMEVIRELADDEPAYRSLTRSWFEHSPLWDIIKQLKDKAWSGVKLIITTDHGTIRVREPSKVIGDRNTSTNLRYKQGKNLRYENREVYDIANPDDILLPKQNISTKYIFAKEQFFFAYPNNYNYYVNYYRNTFQHGGISLEEVVIPFVSLTVK